MNKPMRLGAQVLAYSLFVVFIGYFSNSPPYRHLAPDMATIKLSLRHTGQLLGECRTLGAEELAGMPATMRAVQDCPRERSPLRLELEINGELVLERDMPPPGLHDDGIASMYQRLTVPAGELDIRVRLKDHLAQTEFPYQAERRIHLDPAEVLVIDFDSRNKAFVFL